MAATLRDNCNTQTLFFNFPHGLTEQEGQTITPTEVYVLETIKFYAKWKYGDPGTCYISLQETTSGLPNGSLLTDRLSFTVTADKVLKSITFGTQPTLQIGTKYVIVFEAPSGVASSGELHLYGQPSNGNDYSGGDRVWYNGSVWNTVTSQDLNFYCWGVDATPSKPITPAPSDSSTTVTLDQTTLSWVDGGNADTYDVYFGLSGNMTLQSSAQAGLSWSIDSLPLSYNTAYQWRIDATNVYGTTTGDTWGFTTIAFAPPVATVAGSASPNMLQIIKRLVAAAYSKFWYEDI
ncbi:hypothetical protein LCGC14_1131240 [marine sediment metagenome]|uniref:Fibronectin type-III domain-containing protein n=1 Tax=marine sediment metagenome TaxID=412755 RepID=A0A0F9PJ88_9ZZZZ